MRRSWAQIAELGIRLFEKIVRDLAIAEATRLAEVPISAVWCGPSINGVMGLVT